MDTDQKVAILKQTDLLSFFETSTLQHLAENCVEVRLRNEEMLFDEGSLEIAMYIVLSGEISIFKGNKQIAFLGPGQYLGEMSLIESKPRSASAKAVGDTALLEITEDNFNQYLATEPKALIAIMKTLSSRIRNDLEVMATDLRKLSIFAHDIKNCLSPLALTEFYLHELAEQSEGTQVEHKPRQSTEVLKKNKEVISDTKNNLDTLTNFSLNQAKRIKIDHIKKKTPILPLIEKTIKGISMHKHLAGKKVNVVKSNDVSEGMLNSLDIERALQNLIINAGYVTPENGTIEVAVKTNDNELLFSVADKGCGISDEVKPFLFKDPITTKADGNGFGLLSCKEIIEVYHKGRFWYDSKVGQGTTFYFTIPLQAKT